MIMQQNSECYMVYIQISNRLALQQQCLFGYTINTLELKNSNFVMTNVIRIKYKFLEIKNVHS